MSKVEGISDFQYIKVPLKDIGNVKENQEIPLKYGYGIRHMQLVIFFFCLAISFISRGHIGVTLVAMTSPKEIIVGERVNKENIDYAGNYSNVNDIVEFNVKRLGNENTTVRLHNNTDTWDIYKTYDWPKPIQEIVLNAFFFGYFLTMAPIALVCQRWGGKVPLQVSMLVNGITSILTPWLVMWWDWKAVCACRVLAGMSQAGTYPGLQTLLAQWVPSYERATLNGYVYTGSTIGTLIGFQIAGLFSDAWGWPAAFWAIGCLCLLTFCILTIFGASSPRVHKKITIEEKNYIFGHCHTGAVQKKKIPWKAILTSKPVWANFATHIGSGYSFIFFLTEVPSYIHYILGRNVKSSGVLSSLPYLASFLTSIFFGVISDFFTNRNIVSIKNARRISNTISQTGVAVTLICVSYTSNITIAVICLVVCMSCQMAIHTGWMVNHIDLAPNYSGTLMAIGATLTNFVVLTMPILISNIVVDVIVKRIYEKSGTNPNTRRSIGQYQLEELLKQFILVENVYQWRIMLFLVAGAAFIPAVIFVIFMSADVQPWNEGNVLEADVQDLKLETIMSKKENEQRPK